MGGFPKCCDCRESRLLCDLPKALTDKTQLCGWARFTKKLFAKRASWTRGHFACACVRLLNDNNVGVSNLMAGNRKPGVKLQSFWKPFHWCFKVFRYSFSDTLPIFFYRLKGDFILVRSLWNFRQWFIMDWSLSKRRFNWNRYYYDNNKQKNWKLRLNFLRNIRSHWNLLVMEVCTVRIN